MSDIAYLDISAPANHEVVSLDDLFAGAHRVVRSPIGSPAMSTTPPRPPQPLPPLLAEAFLSSRELPSPGVYLLRNATAIFHFAITLRRQLVIGSDYYPSFYRGEFHRLLAHYARQPRPRKVERLREPVYVPWLWKYHEYGHFLTEMVPRLLLVSTLYARGLKFPVLVPSTPEYVREAAQALAPELKLIPIDNYSKTFAFRECLLPVDGSIDHMFHPNTASLLDSAVERLLERCADTSLASPAKRIFLSRTRFRQARARQTRGLANEHELQTIARDYGFDVVEPQELSFADQVRAVANSSILVGEASSALHNAMFAREIEVISLGWMNNVQTMIAALRSHRVTYLLPPDEPTPGHGRVSFHRFRDAATFEISRTSFEQALETAIERSLVSDAEKSRR